MKQLNDDLIHAQNLDKTRIKRHQARILQALAHEINMEVSIHKSCTIANGGLIPWESIVSKLSEMTEDFTKWQKSHFVNGVIAAGAGSRFFVELKNFVYTVENFLENGLSLNEDEFMEQFSFLPKLVLHFKLGKKVTPTTILKSYKKCQIIIEKYAQLPKLMIPATLEGDSFLDLKLEEQMHFNECLGNVLIVPHNMKKELSKNSNIHAKMRSPWLFLEQGLNLSTIRFQLNGNPYLNAQGHYSPVSAGHGELLRLFDDIVLNYPQIECLHIRNVDNIMGVSSQIRFQFNGPQFLFYKLRSALEKLRIYLPILLKNNEENLEKLNFENEIYFLSQLLNLRDEKTQIHSKKTLTPKGLFAHLQKLFHWKNLHENATPQEILKQILNNCQNPLSVFGVVQKLSGDKGGGPVFVRFGDKMPIKFCLEMSHATQSDCDKYFSKEGQSTHFNPALVFFEMRTHTTHGAKGGKKVDFDNLFDEQFWILAKREYNREPVCYHETVLYELLGNSEKTNLVFLEVPRSLFKPHKSYLDCLTQDRLSYGFLKNFKSKPES